MKLGQYLTFIFLFPFYQVIKIDRFLRIYPQKRILKYEYCRNLQINCCDKTAYLKEWKNICLIRKSGLNNLLKSSAVRYNVTLFINSSPIKARKQSNQTWKILITMPDARNSPHLKTSFWHMGNVKKWRKRNISLCRELWLHMELT